MKTTRMTRLMLMASTVSVVSLLAGCGGGAAGLHYYNLPEYHKPTQITKTPGATTNPVAVSVSPVSLSSFLDGDGIVYQTSPVEFNQAQLNLWADDISDQLTSTLRNNLQSQSGSFSILPSDADASKADHLSVHLDKFQGRYDGMAVIHGSYQLFDSQQHLLLQKPINTTVGLTKDGYPALVTALSSAWQQVANDIAQTLNTNIKSKTP